MGCLLIHDRTNTPARGGMRLVMKLGLDRIVQFD